jgi:hypothetical protein
MPRLTITLSEERHQALKEAAARRDQSIGDVIEESLESFGINTRASAATLVARARENANLDEQDALSTAVEEIRRHRD